MLPGNLCAAAVIRPGALYMRKLGRHKPGLSAFGLALCQLLHPFQGSLPCFKVGLQNGIALCHIVKTGYEQSIHELSGGIEALEKSMDVLDSQLIRYREMEKDAKSLAQDHVLTAELIERLIERIEIDHERNIHVMFRFKNEFQGKAVEPCTKNM